MAVRSGERSREEVGRHGFSRRTALLGTLQIGMASVLAGRLIYLQGYSQDRFRDLAEDNRVDSELIVPRRGSITDRHGTVIAQSIGDNTVMIVRERAGDVNEVLRRVALILPLTAEHLAAIREEMATTPPFMPVLVAHNLTLDQFAKVSFNLPDLPGITCDVLYQRNYPRGETHAHLTGYVGRVSQADLSAAAEATDPLLHHPNFGIGKSGLEKTMESSLRGLAGRKSLEVNAAGRIVRELNRDRATPGKTLRLTIDDTLQTYATDRMQGQTGGCIALDLATHDILAMVSLPSFDPNKFARGISHADYRAYVEDPDAPLFNRSTGGTYPPGSTFKMMTALAALEAGHLGPDDEFYCGGYHENSNRRFHCWNRHGHGQVNLRKALRESCDVYFYRVAEIVLIAELAAMASRFGFGQAATLPLTSLTTGLLPSVEWKRRRFDEPWHVGDTLNASIGQGFVTATCLQVATMTARIATGKAFTPRIIQAIDNQEQAVDSAPDLPLDPTHLQLIRESMHAVMNDEAGTAFAARCTDPAYQLAGKTGTSQVTALLEDVDQLDLPREMRHHALFCGYAPSAAPRYAVAVIVEHGMSGSEMAAPIARDVLMRLNYGPQPPLAAYPPTVREAIRQRREEERRRLDDDRDTLIPI